jgi:hypothetical protein
LVVTDSNLGTGAGNSTRPASESRLPEVLGTSL